MHENRLLMNESKTEFLLTGTKKQLAKVNVDQVKVGNADGVMVRFESVYGRAHY